jgi:hypothetical protein
MKYLKMLGLAAVAAMAVMAFIGAASASATVLCENTPAAGTDCNNPVKINTSIDFSVENGTSAILTGPFGEIIDTCTGSTAKGPVTDPGSTTTTVKGSLEAAAGGALTFTGCTKTTTVITGGTIEVHHITGTDNGTVTSSGATVIIHNTLFGECAYKTSNTDIGTITGRTSTGAQPTFDIKGTIPAEKSNSGVTCPNGVWEGSYEYTNTTLFDVAAG